MPAWRDMGSHAASSRSEPPSERGLSRSRPRHGLMPVVLSCRRGAGNWISPDLCCQAEKRALEQCHTGARCGQWGRPLPGELSPRGLTRHHLSTVGYPQPVLKSHVDCALGGERKVLGMDVFSWQIVCVSFWFHLCGICF